MVTWEPTDEQWWKMCDAHMSLPVPLHTADLSHPFVYDRELGVFYVPFGYHQMAMALLLAFTIDEVDVIDAGEKLGLNYSNGSMSDSWLSRKGRCFKSSVSAKVYAGYRGNLNIAEIRIFKDVEYILEKS